jgi:hypothetical protein
MGLRRPVPPHPRLSGARPMASTEPSATRGQLRAWLKTAIKSGMLDRLPPYFEPEGGVRRDVLDHAHALLIELQERDSATRPPGEVLAEVRRFRAWVDDRLRRSRRIILAEGSVEEMEVPRPVREVRRPAPAPPAQRSPEPRPELDPMWDRWVDG